MLTVRPGYGAADSCAWVGVDPVYVVPPLRHAEHPHDRAFGSAGVTEAAAVPEQRAAEIVLEPEAPAPA